MEKHWDFLWKFDCARVTAATNKDLEAAIKEHTFRENLYYRLKVIHIQTPSLRDAPENIPVLANPFPVQAL
jgi:DNA-binding NtrC family response regulator